MKKKPRKIIPEMEKLGADFRTRRKRLLLSQEEVASWIGSSQRQISLFESGLARLAPKDIETLFARLERLERGLGIESLEFRPLNLLSEGEFLIIQQKMLNAGIYDGLWLFGIRHLPVLRDTAYQDTWADNIGKGISYNMIMVLDKLMEEPKFQLLQNTISEVCQKVKSGGKPGHGKINIFGITIGNINGENVESELAETCTYFERLETHLNTHFKGFASVRSPICITEPKYHKCRSILHYGWLRSVVYYQGVHDINSFAAVLFEHISNNPKHSGPGESGWTFLTRDAAAALLVYIRAFAQAVNFAIE